LTYEVEAHLYAACAVEAKSLLSTLEAGDSPNLDDLTRTFGTAIEFAACDLFSQNDAARHYWVDGVVIDAVSLQPNRIVFCKGRAWCADRSEQWQIPIEIECRFSAGQEPNLLLLAIRIGNAAMTTLGDHRKRSITKIGTPKNWLLEFDARSK
jgi:hypothetical protein